MSWYTIHEHNHSPGLRNKKYLKKGERELFEYFVHFMRQLLCSCMRFSAFSLGTFLFSRTWTGCCIKRDLCINVLMFSCGFEVGESTRRSPLCGALNISNTVCFNIICGVIRRICTSHCKRRALIHVTRSKLCGVTLVSSCADFFVLILSILALVPLSALITSSVSLYVSDP